MLNNRQKLGLAACLSIFIFMLSGCLSLIQIVKVAGDNQEQLPVRSLTIAINLNQRKALFDQLQKFADKNSLEYLMSDFGANEKRFAVEMLGNHTKILIDDTPKAPELIAVDFYDQHRAHPIPEETVKAIDELVNDLKTFIGKIPNVTITQEK